MCWNGFLCWIYVLVCLIFFGMCWDLCCFMEGLREFIMECVGLFVGLLGLCVEGLFEILELV